MDGRCGSIDLISTWRKQGEDSRTFTDPVHGQSWTTLKMKADRATPSRPAEGGVDASITGRVVTSRLRPGTSRYLRLLRDDIEIASLSAQEREFAEMLYFTAIYQKGKFGSLDEAFRCVRSQRAFVDEVEEIFERTLSVSRSNPGETALGGATPILAHAHYRREEILSGLGAKVFDKSPDGVHVSGVAWSEELSTDAFLIYPKKSVRDFSPTTMNRDYAVRRDQVHWESQNNTRESSARAVDTRPS